MKRKADRMGESRNKQTKINKVLNTKMKEIYIQREMKDKKTEQEHKL